MILTLDVGNQNIVMCCVEDGKKLSRCVISASKSRTAAEFSLLMEQLARRDGLALHSATGAIMASVVPGLTAVISDAVEQCAGCRPLVVGPGVKSGLNIRMDDPTQLGGDLVAGAVAVLERYRLPSVFIDMGAATAIGVIDSEGSYVGGLICPGVTLSQDSLSQGASQLSDIRLEPPKRIIGKNTRESMLNGLIYGAAAILDGILSRIETELGQRVTVIATGENARDIIPHCYRDSILIDDDLIMRGLWRIYCKNTER